MAKKKPSEPSSPAIMRLLDLLGRRWTLRVLWELRDGPLTFTVLQERCGSLSPTIVSRRLAELKQAGLIVVDPRGYALTSMGEELGTKLLDLSEWAARWTKAE